MRMSISAQNTRLQDDDEFCNDIIRYAVLGTFSTFMQINCVVRCLCMLEVFPPFAVISVEVVNQKSNYYTSNHYTCNNCYYYTCNDYLCNNCYYYTPIVTGHLVPVQTHLSLISWTCFQ